jgi:hypothetical protein
MRLLGRRSIPEENPPAKCMTVLGRRSLEDMVSLVSYFERKKRKKREPKKVHSGF